MLGQLSYAGTQSEHLIRLRKPIKFARRKKESVMTLVLGNAAINPVKWREVLATMANSQSPVSLMSAAFIRDSETLNEIEALPELALEALPERFGAPAERSLALFLADAFNSVLHVLPENDRLGDSADNAYRVFGLLNALVTIRVDNSSSMFDVNILQLIVSREPYLLAVRAAIMRSPAGANLVMLSPVLNTRGRSVQAPLTAAQTAQDLFNYLQLINKRPTAQVASQIDAPLRSVLTADGTVAAMFMYVYSAGATGEQRSEETVDKSLTYLLTALQDAAQRIVMVSANSNTMLGVVWMQRDTRTRFLKNLRHVVRRQSNPLFFMWAERIYDVFWDPRYRETLVNTLVDVVRLGNEELDNTMYTRLRDFQEFLRQRGDDN